MSAAAAWILDALGSVWCPPCLAALAPGYAPGPFVERARPGDACRRCRAVLGATP